jgi:hypothetical protein
MMLLKTKIFINPFGIVEFIAAVAQSGTAQDWKSCFLRDIPVQIRAAAFFYNIKP